MMNLKFNSLAAILFVVAACTHPKKENSVTSQPSPYEEDVAFLKRYSHVIELSDNIKKSKIAVMPALQARVMTSTSGSPESGSYGWINKSLFESGDTSIHINAFGGEERFWLGPEGGQFSIFFEKGKEFSLENWHTPKLIDLEQYELISNTNNSATFSKTASLINYSGTVLNVKITREIKVLESENSFKQLEVDSDTALNVVAYQTINTIHNTGNVPWNKKTGLLSIWLLGMFNPSPTTTIIIPFTKGTEKELGSIVNDDYFGKVPADRLKIGDGIIYFKGDGLYRSKIGLSPARAKDVAGSYDPASKTLTLIQYVKPDGEADYVNSKWEIQREPFKGDVINSYNDGPPSPGAKPFGPFYELETSSPAKELKPGESLTHIQTTFHFQGAESNLNPIALKMLGVSLAEIKLAFNK